MFCVNLIPFDPERFPYRCSQYSREEGCTPERVRISSTKEAVTDSSSQVVGTEGSPMARSPRTHLLHSKRLLHILGRLYNTHRSMRIHPTRPRPPRRFRTYVVRNLSRKMGKLRRKFLAIHPSRFNRRDVRSSYHTHRAHVWILRRRTMHLKQILHLFQFGALYPRFDHMHPPSHSGSKSSFRFSTSEYGSYVLYLSHHVGTRESF